MSRQTRNRLWLRCLTLATGLLLAATTQAAIAQAAIAQATTTQATTTQATTTQATTTQATTILAADQTSRLVEHFVSYPSSKQQYLEVRSEFPVNSAETEVLMPNWTPGSYTIKNFGANVERLSAVSESGTPLAVQKVSKDTWRIQTPSVQRLIVTYEVYTPTLSVQTSWVEPDFTLINGASVFLYTRDTRSIPQSLTVNAGADRGDVFTALPTAGSERVFRAENYDSLVDNPVVVANAPVHRFSVGEQEYAFLNVGESASWDAAKATADLRKMVQEAQKLWQVNPLSRAYWFLNFSVGGKGGLEHDHSTVTMTGRSPMKNRKTYVKWLGLITHEFFHAWNVRRMRPEVLQSYDYQNEQYSNQLWLAEGFTSYYDNVLLVRAGLITPSEYLQLLAKDMHLLLNTPGRKLRPVSEASLDAWSRHYKPNANALNSTVSYYNKGAVIGFVLDAYLREQSKGRSSLDDLMRELYRRYSTTGYSAEDFMAVLAEFGGTQAVAFIEQLLNTTEDPDVDAALDWYGLELHRNDYAYLDDTQPPPLGGFGVIWDNRQAEALVKSVRAESAGAIAGLLPGDEVLAIGSERMMRDNYLALMERFHPGQSTTLLVSRRGQIKTLNLTMDAALSDHYVIGVQKRINGQTLNRLEGFLGQDL